MAARRRRHQVVDWPTMDHTAGSGGRVQDDIQACLDRWWPITRCRTDGSPWWSDVTPFEFLVVCSGQRHMVRFDAGELVLEDHSGDRDRERTFARLAGAAGCFEIVDAWEHGDRTLLRNGRRQFSLAVEARAIHVLAHGDEMTSARREAVASAASRDLTKLTGESVAIWMDDASDGLTTPWIPGSELSGGLPGSWFTDVWLRGLAVVDGFVVERIVHPDLSGGSELHVEVVPHPKYRGRPARRGVIRKGSDGLPTLWVNGCRVEAPR